MGSWPLVLAFSLAWGAGLGLMHALPPRFQLAAWGGLFILAGLCFVRERRVYLMSFLALSFFLGNSKTIIAPSLQPFERLVMTADDIFLILLCVCWFAESLRSREPRRREPRSLLLPLAALFAAVLLSLMNVREPLLAGIELTRIAKTALLYWVVLHNVRSMDEVRRIMLCLAAGLFLQCGTAAYQKYVTKGQGKSYFGEASSKIVSNVGEEIVYRPGGTLGHPNRLATYLDILIPLMLALSFSTVLSPGYRRIFALAFAAACASLFFTLSRGGMLGTGLALCGCFALLARRNLRLKVFLPRTMLAMLAACLGAAALYKPLHDRFTKRDYGAVEARIFQYQVAGNIIAAHPWVGVGINTFRMAAPDFDDTPIRIATGFPFPVHNVYLLALSETGVAGTLATVLLILAILNLAYFGRWPYGEHYELHLGLFFGVVAYLLHMNVDINQLGSFGFLFFLLAVLSAAHRLGLERLRAPEASSA